MPGFRLSDAEVLGAQHLFNAGALGSVVLDDEHLLDVPVHVLSDVGHNPFERLLRHGLLEIGDRVDEGAPVFVDDRDDLDGNMAGLAVPFQLVEEPPAVQGWQAKVQRYGVGHVLVGHLEAGLTVEGDDALKALAPRDVQQDVGEGWIVLDDQEGTVALRDRWPIVRSRLGFL